MTDRMKWTAILGALLVVMFLGLTFLDSYDERTCSEQTYERVEQVGRPGGDGEVRVVRRDWRNGMRGVLLNATIGA